MQALYSALALVTECFPVDLSCQGKPIASHAETQHLGNLVKKLMQYRPTSQSAERPPLEEKEFEAGATELDEPATSQENETDMRWGGKFQYQSHSCPTCVVKDICCVHIRDEISQIWEKALHAAMRRGREV